jgi:NADH-quinone oxidoreductase subunit E|tara:strand:+ start:1239 stop:1706 length:468 start_codon:yes stop_codon:yes gene_type:complete
LTETELKERLTEVLTHYTGQKNELIPVLQAAQEQFGYLPAEVMQEIARFLRISESTVYGVSTFYAQFKFQPTGKKKVRLCRGTACHVRGVSRILDEVEKQLGIKPGETTSDLEYSLETIACFGSCALAPVMVVGNNVYGRMTPKKVAPILDGTEQ